MERGQHLNELPAILVELGRLWRLRCSEKSCGVHYSCNPGGRRSAPHLLTCWVAGEPDHDFMGATFGDVYRPAYDLVRSLSPAAAGEAEYDSWLRALEDPPTDFELFGSARIR